MNDVYFPQIPFRISLYCPFKMAYSSEIHADLMWTDIIGSPW
jgi:hypothetical protein